MTGQGEVGRAVRKVGEVLVAYGIYDGAASFVGGCLITDTCKAAVAADWGAVRGEVEDILQLVQPLMSQESLDVAAGAVVAAQRAMGGEWRQAERVAWCADLDLLAHSPDRSQRPTSAELSALIRMLARRKAVV